MSTPADQLPTPEPVQIAGTDHFAVPRGAAANANGATAVVTAAELIPSITANTPYSIEELVDQMQLAAIDKNMDNHHALQLAVIAAHTMVQPFEVYVDARVTTPDESLFDPVEWADLQLSIPGTENVNPERYRVEGILKMGKRNLDIRGPDVPFQVLEEEGHLRLYHTVTGDTQFAAREFVLRVCYDTVKVTV